MEKQNKNIILGASLAFASFAGFMWLKNKLPLTPKVPVVDEKTALLFQLSYSSYSLKVARYFDYKGIPYRPVDILPVIHRKFLKDLSGQSKVPVVKYKGRIMHDSTSIIKYFEDMFPEPTLTFKDNEELNKEIMLLEDWADEALFPPIRALSLIYMYEHPEIVNDTPDYNTGIEVLDKNLEKVAPLIAKKMMDSYDISVSQKDSLKKKVRANLDLLSSKLEGKQYLIGDRLTLADLAVASHLSTAQAIPYIYEDDLYSHIFEWQRKILNSVKRRFTAKVN